MKEVGDKIGSGELILPFVLQSAEVMRNRIILEKLLERLKASARRWGWLPFTAMCMISARIWSRQFFPITL
jgi:hypothetical protein